MHMILEPSSGAVELVNSAGLVNLQALKPVCARPPASQSLRRIAELVRMSGDSGVGSGVLMLEWRSPGEEGIVGVADLTCARSAVRHLVSFVHPVDQLCWFGHVSGLVVPGRDDLAARSAFAISFFPPQVDLLEAPDGGAEDEVSRLIAVWGCLKLVLSADF
ncbi:hypothetical protein BHE74_00057551 [Ensete ventricosum]|nr:hypothetical protein BHE74_00057551 [Ensete ventricosum]